ncbi:DUF2059 domain-containing protein [Sphingobium sp. JS3065]|uniref:DUF2059 domain-containing protein n=1 Tax=Sphingobium sp. JS3065 TaxID=2970925 RepID=UPI0022654AD0|nr:DUF2059 domain-containing protein [Sphingobium sp. JS3065]UZW54389.1 DUF2059 domain-containing protein [Sphingobium sp. JS3065]
MRALRSSLIGLALLAAQVAQAQGAPDAARIAAARPVVDKIFPVGTYRRMMDGTLSKMMDGMMDGVMKMPVAQLARIGGVPQGKLSSMDETSMEQISAIIDPNFRERTKRGMDAMMASMADLMDGFEPKVRDALARAYARRFDGGQLSELAAFFRTPTGDLYARESMMMFMDPEIMSEMQALMPEMMKKMPDMAAKAEAATKSLPPPRKIADLSQEERGRLAKLLGVKASDLHDGAATHDEGTK